MSRTRRPLLATILVFTSLLAACADPMAPRASTRARDLSGSAEVQAGTPTTTGTSSGSTNTGTGTRQKGTGSTSTKSPDGAKSGYNVTA